MNDSRRQFHALAAIFLIAAVVRLGYWSQARGTVLDRWHEWEQSDMSTYLEQSRRFVQGDWLGREPYHPYHLWQRTIPREKWEAWSHPKSFHQAPGYSYALAALRALSPDGYGRIAKLVQALLGAASAALACFIARRLFGSAAGWIAGLIVALYGPLVYIELQFLREAPSIFLTFAAFAVLVGVWRGPEVGEIATDAEAAPSSPWRACGTLFLAGSLIGLLGLFHESGKAALFAAAVATFARYRPGGRRRLAPALAALALGWLAGFSPMMIRNVIVGAPVTSVSTRGAISLALVNDPTSPPGEVAWGRIPPGFEKLMDDSGGSGSRLVFAIARGYLDRPGALFAHLGEKLHVTFAARELPDNTSYDFFRGRAWSLRLLPGFWIVFAPAAAGVALLLARMAGAPRELRSTFAPELALLVHLGLVVLALVAMGYSGRHRLFAFPAMAIVASAFYAELARRLVAVLPGARFRALISAPAASNLVEGRAFGVSLVVLLLAAMTQAYCQATLSIQGPRKGDYAEAGNLERASGDYDRAIADYREAIRLGMTDAGLHQALAQTLWKADRFAEAMEEYRLSVEGDADKTGPAHLVRMRGWAMALATCPVKALRDPEKALALAREIDGKSGHHEPLDLATLAAAQAACGRMDEARTSCGAALALARTAGNEELARKLQAQLAAYGGAVK